MATKDYTRGSMQIVYWSYLQVERLGEIWIFKVTIEIRPCFPTS